jgi:hypothetical protein
MTVSFMNALSLSKSTPINSQGNRPWRYFIASTMSAPSRLTNGTHSVQPVATTARHELHIAEQAVNACSADGENTVTIRLVKLQSVVSLKCRQQGRNHHLEPFAAHPI